MLDEVGDMPAETQAKLLRVLETKEVVPVGATEGDKVDVRLVCATHRDLRRRVDTGAFRADLFARIQGCVIELPALRERKEDIYPLARHFAGAAGRADVPVTFRFIDALLAYDWPFNVRELQDAMRHAIALSNGAVLDVEHLPEAVLEGPRVHDVSGHRRAEAEATDAARAPAESAAQPATESPPAEQLRALLTRHRGNIAAVARELGKDRAQIHRWLRYARIDPTEYR
jgi:DNA-binding NtrC family response regulator